MGALWNSQADKVLEKMENKSAMLMIIWTLTMTLLKVVVTTYKVVTVLETVHNYEAKESRKRAAGTLEDHHDHHKHLIESKAAQSRGKEEESGDDKPESDTEKRPHKKKSHADEERQEKKKKSKKKKHKHKDKSWWISN